MDENNFQKWAYGVDLVFFSQIILDKLKKNKKINLKQHREIEKKIKKIRYENFLSSPHFEGKEELRKEALISCIQNNFPSIFFTE